MEAVNGVSEGEKGGPPPPSPLTGCYLLIVIGEPHTSDHKDIILQRVAKGLLSWDVNDCLVDLEKELAIITEQALEGEEARYGERLIQFASENLVTEILIHPVVSTLAQCVRNLLSSFTRHRHIIHAGYTFAANGSWALQDGTFSLADFSEAFQEIEVQRVIRAYENGISLDLHCSPEGDWCRLPKELFAKSCKLRVNPNDVLTAGTPSITNFINYISPFLIPTSLENLLESSDVVGNIRFSRPTLYVFPGGQGDAALFGINGFNMLLDGGYSRKACFWDFVRHLDRLDAVLMTRLNNSNVNGISSVLKRKKQDAVYPQIGHFFCNIMERKSILSPDGDKDKDPLLINLLDEGQEIISNLRHLNLNPQVCYRDSEPINLYHKVGHGTLDMYVLSPAKDSKEVREFLHKWNNSDQKLFANQKSSREFVFPIQNMISICALLVWQPANPNDTITRILFPGSSPQKKIFEGLDRIKQLEFVKYPVCTEKSLTPVSIIKSKQKDTILDKVIPTEKPKVPTEKKEKPKPENKLIENSIKNGELNGVITDKTKSDKIVKKSDSTDSEKSTKGKKADEKIQENGDQAKTKPKPEPKQHKLRTDSQHRKKQVEKKASPTTPKKTVDNKLIGDSKPKIVSKSSPSATPAKSTKDANNRKVIESKKSTQPKKEVVAPKPAEPKPKVERKPISRRPKDVPKAPISPIKRINGIQKPDSISKKGKLDKEGTTDSSTVSTPSADQESLQKKDITKLTPEELQQLKAQELADLKEEQEAVKEIEAVFKKGEKVEAGDTTNLRKIKDLSIDDKMETEEYLIIEKEEIEHDSLEEKETKEDETQKLARDSEESEKQRKLSAEEIKEAEEVKEITKEKVLEIKEEVSNIVEEAVDIAKSKDASEKSPDEKVDDKKEVDEEVKEAAQESQPDEKCSANVESGATTTAPTLPEDERIPLDEIKEDNGQVIEEKHIKEETKEKDIPVIQLPTKTPENLGKLPPVIGIKLDKQSHIRDIVKTPDEVADLPMHEEVDVQFADFTQDNEKDKPTVEETDAKAFDPKTKSKVEPVPETKDNEKQLKKSPEHQKDVCEKELTKSPDEEKETDEHELEVTDKKTAEVDKKSERKDSVITKEEVQEKHDIHKTEAKEDKHDEHESVPDGTKYEEVTTLEKDEPVEYQFDNDLNKNEDKSKDTKLKLDNLESINDNEMVDIKEFIEVSSPILKEHEKKDPEVESIQRISTHIDDLKKIEDKLKDLKDEHKVEMVSIDHKTHDAPLHAEAVIISSASTPDSPKITHPDLPDKIELGRKSPKEREEDVIKIVTSVAEVLKSDAPLEEFAGKIPFNTFTSYTTELRETHITTVESPQIENKDINTIPEEPACPKVSSLEFLEQEKKHASIPEVDETQEVEHRSSLIKDSQELIIASSKIISDIKSKTEEPEKVEEDGDSGTVHRMLVTASSEDGGEEIEICPPGTITFSRSSESSGRSSPDIHSQKASQKSSIVDTISESIVTVQKLKDPQSEKDSGFDDKNDSTKSVVKDEDKPAPDFQKTTSDMLIETEKIVSGILNSDIKSEKPETVSDKNVESGKSSTGKTTPELHDSRKSSVISPFVDSGKTSPDKFDVRKESITKITPLSSGKLTPDDLDSEKSTPEVEQDHRKQSTGLTAEDIRRMSIELEKYDSGKTTPDRKASSDKISPAKHEDKNLIPEDQESTPEPTKVESRKQSIESSALTESRKSISEAPKTKLDSGKSSPDLQKDKLDLEKTSPKSGLSSGKQTPEPKDKTPSPSKGGLDSKEKSRSPSPDQILESKSRTPRGSIIVDSEKHHSISPTKEDKSSPDINLEEKTKTPRASITADHISITDEKSRSPSPDKIVETKTGTPRASITEKDLQKSEIPRTSVTEKDIHLQSGKQSPSDKSPSPQQDKIDKSRSPSPDKISGTPRASITEKGVDIGRQSPLDKVHSPQQDKIEKSRSPSPDKLLEHVSGTPRASITEKGVDSGKHSPLDKAPSPQQDKTEKSRSPSPDKILEHVSGTPRASITEKGVDSAKQSPLDKAPSPQQDKIEKSRSPSPDKILEHVSGSPRTSLTEKELHFEQKTGTPRASVTEKDIHLDATKQPLLEKESSPQHDKKEKSRSPSPDKIPQHVSNTPRASVTDKDVHLDSGKHSPLEVSSPQHVVKEKSRSPSPDKIIEHVSETPRASITEKDVHLEQKTETPRASVTEKGFHINEEKQSPLDKAPSPQQDKIEKSRSPSPDKMLEHVSGTPRASITDKNVHLDIGKQSPLDKAPSPQHDVKEKSRSPSPDKTLEHISGTPRASISEKGVHIDSGKQSPLEKSPSQQDKKEKSRSPSPDKILEHISVEPKLSVTEKDIHLGSTLEKSSSPQKDDKHKSRSPSPDKKSPTPSLDKILEDKSATPRASITDQDLHLDNEKHSPSSPHDIKKSRSPSPDKNLEHKSASPRVSITEKELNLGSGKQSPDHHLSKDLDQIDDKKSATPRASVTEKDIHLNSGKHSPSEKANEVKKSRSPSPDQTVELKSATPRASITEKDHILSKEATPRGSVTDGLLSSVKSSSPQDIPEKSKSPSPEPKKDSKPKLSKTEEDLEAVILNGASDLSDSLEAVEEKIEKTSKGPDLKETSHFGTQPKLSNKTDEEILKNIEGMIETSDGGKDFHPSAPAKEEVEDTVKKEVAKPKESSFSLFGSITSSIGHILDDTKSTLEKCATDFKETIAGEAEQLDHKVKEIVDKAETEKKNIVNDIISEGKVADDNLKSTFQGFSSGIGCIVSSVESKVDDAKKNVQEAIKDVDKSLTDIKHDITEKKENLEKDIKESIDASKTKIDEKKNEFEDTITGFTDSLKKETETVEANIKESLQSADQKIVDFKKEVEGKVDDFKSSIEAKKEEVKGDLAEVGKEIKDGIEKKIEDLKDSIDTKTEVIKDNIVDKIEDVKTSVDSKKQHIEEGLKEAIDTTSNKVQELKDNLTDVKKHVQDSIDKKVDDVKDVVEAKKEDIKDGVKSVDKKLEEAKESIDLKKEEIKTEVTDTITSVNNKIHDIKDSINSKTTELKDNVSHQVEDVSEKIKDVHDTLDHKVKDIKDAVGAKKEDLERDVNDSIAAVDHKIGEIKESVDIKTSDLKDTVDHKIEDLKDAVGAKKEDLEKDVKDSIEAVDHKIGEIKESVNTKTCELKDVVDHKVADVKDSVDAKKEELEKEVKDTIAAADTKIGEIKESIDTKTSEFKDAVDHKIEDVKDAVGTKKEELQKEIKETIDTKASELKDAVDHKIEGVKDAISTKKEELEKNISESIDAVKHEISDIKESIDSKKTELKDAVDHKIEDVKDVVGITKEELKKDVKDSINAAGQKIDEIKESIDTKASDLKDTIDHKIENVKEAVGAKKEELVKDLDESIASADHKIGEIKESIDSKSSQLKDAVDHKIEDVKDAAGSKKEELEKGVKESIVAAEHKIDEIKGSLETKTSELKDKVEDIKDSIDNKARDVKDSVGDKIEDVKDTVSHTKDVIETKKNDLEKDVKDSIDSIASKTTEVKDNLSHDLAEAGKGLETTLKTMGQTIEDVHDSVGQQIDSTAHKIEDAKESTAHKMEDAKDSISKKTDEVEKKVDNKISGLYSNIEEMTESLKKDASEFEKQLQDLADSCDKKTKDSKDQVDAKGKELQKDVKERVEESGGFFSKMLSSVEHTFEDLTKSLSSKSDTEEKQITDFDKAFDKDLLPKETNVVETESGTSDKDLPKEVEEVCIKKRVGSITNGLLESPIEDTKQHLTEKLDKTATDVKNQTEKGLHELLDSMEKLEHRMTKTSTNLSETATELKETIKTSMEEESHKTETLVDEIKDAFQEMSKSFFSSKKSETEKVIEQSASDIEETFETISDMSKSVIFDKCVKEEIPQEELQKASNLVEKSAKDIDETFDTVKDMSQSIVFEKCEKSEVTKTLEESARDLAETFETITDMSKSVIFEPCGKPKESEKLEEKCDKFKSEIIPPIAEDTIKTDNIETDKVSDKAPSIHKEIEDASKLGVDKNDVKKLSISEVDISFTEVDPKVMCDMMLDNERRLYSPVATGSSDVGDVHAKDEKHILGSTTPPTVPVSPQIRDTSPSFKSDPKKPANDTLSSIMKEVDVRSSTPGSDDFEIASSLHSDISSSQFSRAPYASESERLESDEEEDIPGSPRSITSQVVHSRSSSHYDFDEDANRVSKIDPMHMSFYGALPDEPELSEPIQEKTTTSVEVLPTHLYEITKAKFSSHSEQEHVDSDVQIKKNDKEINLMTSSFIGTELPSASQPQEQKKDPLQSWGKPLGLPSPAPPDNKGTPKKEKKLPPNVTAKNKLNDDKKRSESPSKYRSKKMNPIYVDLTYVPHHGNSYYSYVDFFKRIRARYYVFSGIEPSREVYHALLEAKMTWEDKELEVTIIPTYDTDILGYWVAENEELLTKYKIDLSPSASRCTINLQDHETSCSAYRLEF